MKYGCRMCGDTGIESQLKDGRWVACRYLPHLTPKAFDTEIEIVPYERSTKLAKPTDVKHVQ